jgi:hypothetical protein
MMRKTRVMFWACGLSAALIACTSDDDAQDRPGGDPDASAPARDAAPVADAAPAPLGECEGFRLEGLLYSPGGTVLPNKCEPFHPTTNNPYAVRCIDAWPHYRTRFPGDEYCILPPPPDKGIQVGLHPQGPDWFEQVSQGDLSGYDDLDQDWVLPAGGEQTINFRSGADNPEPHNYYRTYFRQRIGSHHNIVTMHEAGMEREVWLPGQDLPGLFGNTSGQLIGTLGGQQRPDDSTPVTLEKPAEDAGLYLVWPANPTLLFNMHHFNVTDGDILKEGWANIWWEDDAETRVSWFMGLDFGQVATLNIAPGETRDLHYSWTINSATPLRLLRVFGHRHAWTSNYSSWIEREGGEVELVYQSFDWFDMPTYRYDSVVQNPPLNPEARRDGAASGVVQLEQGDKLHFNCHVAFTDERAAAVDGPRPAEIARPLRFANQAFTGEMCIQFGNVSGGGLGQPTPDSTPLPDFATLD